MSLQCRTLPNPPQQPTRPKRRAAERQSRWAVGRTGAGNSWRLE